MYSNLRLWPATLLASICLAGCIEPGEAAKAPFNYETATVDEQTAWLTAEAEALQKGFQRGANVGPIGFDVDPAKTNVKAKTVLITAHMQGKRRITINTAQSRKIHKSICKNYERSKLMSQGIKSTFVIKRSDGSIALRLSDGKHTCQQVMAMP